MASRCSGGMNGIGPAHAVLGRVGVERQVEVQLTLAGRWAEEHFGWLEVAV